MIFNGRELPERMFDLHVRYRVLAEFVEVGVDWILANATWAEFRFVRVSGEKSLQMLEESCRCDLGDLDERHTAGAWLQALAQAARESD